MNLLMVFGIIAVIAHTPSILAGDSDEDSSSSSDSGSSSSSSEKSSSKKEPVKLIKNNILQASPKYYSTKYTVDVKKVSESYNALVWKFTVLQDFPSDTKVTVKVYGSKTKDESYESIGDYSLGLGDTNNKYYKYLPAGVIKGTQSAKTFKKGYYESEDTGVFRFYKLISKKKLTYSYYKMIYNYECNGETILSLDQRFETNHY